MMDIVYHDIPRIYTAIAEWGSCMVYLAFIKRQEKRANYIFKCGAALAVQIFFLEITGGLPQVFWIPCMLSAALLMYLFIFLCGKVTPRECLYCCAKAFLLAELTASLEWQIYTYMPYALGTETCSPWVNPVLLIVIFSAVFTVAYHIEREMFSKNYLEKLSTHDILVAAGCVVAVFALSNLSFVVTNAPFSAHIKTDIFIIRTLIDMIGAAILYAFQSRICEFAAETEIRAVQNVLNSQYEQYRNYLDSMEMIHIMRHDLKHQIDGLRMEEDADKRAEWIEAMEQELNEHDIAMKTGNKALDAVLGSKSLRAKKSNIQMTCVINGELLDFLHVTDICSIFGNALDNAIENAVMIPDEKKRLIHITVSEQKGFIFIKIANFCENPVSIKPGHMPETTKADKKNHGFGIKSIRHSAEKYGGTVTAAMEQQWFVLSLLFPKKQD